MIEKLVYSMFHGNTRTKLFLWSVTVFGVAALVLIVCALALEMPMMGLCGAGCALVGFIVSQSVSLKDLQREKKPAAKKKNGKAAPKKGSAKQAAEGADKASGNEKEEEGAAGGGHPKKARERAKAKYLSGLDAKKLKKLLKDHKVNQIHVEVMIDSFPEKRIEQAPAFMWKTDKMLHFLIMSGQAEEFEVPLSEIKSILLVKGVEADPDADYMPFKYSNYITKMFQPYLPEYSEVTKDGELKYHKNVFRIEPGIHLTNTSVANLRRVLLPGVAFVVVDKVTASSRFNEYFKEMYRSSLLCKNNVITLEEYREQMKKTLDDLLEAPIPGKEFVSTVYDLNKYHLIPRETVTEYSQKYRELYMNKN